MTEVHPTAIVSPEAELGDDVVIGPFCIVGSRVRIGSGSVLAAYVTVLDFVEIGSGCRLFHHAVIGGEPQDHIFGGEETWVRIGDHVILREYVTVNRATGAGECTSIGDHCLVMEGVHLAHNTHLGKNVIVTNKVGLAGFASVDDGAVLGGMAGLHQFVRVGKLCMIGGLSKVVKDVPPFFMVDGNPLKAYGLNVVGMRRAGYGAQERRAVRSFYETLFYGDRPFREMVERYGAREDRLSEVEREILAFCRESKRGVVRWSQGHHEKEGEGGHED